MKTIHDSEHNPQCAAQHIGPWLIEPAWFGRAVSAVKSGVWQPLTSKVEVEDGLFGKRVLYSVEESGVAVVPMVGPMMKGDSKYGGVSTLRTRRALRAAVADRSVAAIMLAIDSPGGTVSGTQELAREVRRAREAKPVYAHIEDLGASAAYWVAAQAQQITINEMGLAGSIGTLAVVEDTSGMAEMMGIKVHVVSTGDYKGAFSPGTEITEEHLDYLQNIVDETNKHFLAAVSEGRSMTPADVRKSADGRVFTASDAKERGLVDKVAAMDDVLESVSRRHNRGGRQRARAVLDLRSRALKL